MGKQLAMAHCLSTNGTSLKVPRLERDIGDMVRRLNEHRIMLREHCHQAFVENRDAYCGEVAGKIRLLATRHPRNKHHRPLLLDLMDATKILPSVTLGGLPIQKAAGEPRSGDEISLERFMQLEACRIRNRAGVLVPLTKSEFVRAWAEQSGSAHEDWGYTEEWRAVLDTPLWVNGRQVHILELQATANTVLKVADRFFDAYGRG